MVDYMHLFLRYRTDHSLQRSLCYFGNICKVSITVSMQKSKILTNTIWDMHKNVNQFSCIIVSPSVRDRKGTSLIHEGTALTATKEVAMKKKKILWQWNSSCSSNHSGMSNINKRWNKKNNVFFMFVTIFKLRCIFSLVNLFYGF